VPSVTVELLVAERHCRLKLIRFPYQLGSAGGVTRT
jgi:hypothetical protein